MEGHTEKVKIESIKLLYTYALRAIPFNFFIAFVAVLYLFNQASLLILIFFLLSIFALTALRYIHVRLNAKVSDWEENSYKYYLLFIIGCFSQGLLWSAWYLYFVSHLSIESQYFMLLLLSGLAAGSMATMSSMSGAYFSYALPMLVLPACWYFYNYSEQNLSIAGIIILYIVGISISYFRTQAFIHSAIKLNFENQELIDKLTASNQELEQSNKIIQAVSLIDDLTQIANRRHFHFTLEKEWSRNQRTKSPISILMMDIDCFKNYNDALGHQAGDACLRMVASILQSQIKRSGDFLARYGGEEFICILPNTDAVGARTVAQYIQQALRREQLPHPDSSVEKNVTVSIGVATVTPNDDSDIDTLIKKADKYLYKAKSMGRNKIAYG